MSEPSLRTGQTVEGFSVVRVTPLPDLRSVAYELEHPSGARVLHVHNDDPESLFSVAFKTPPIDDTGLPHILEHSVLCGSKRFPVKHPFIELTKMSMATFINAMTASDMTLYPVASNVKKDLFNLAEVYWDAVFHPRLSEETFKQEGHHREFEKKGDPSSPLIVKGIVFNEMKGAYSSPERLVSHYANQTLFAATPYGKSSGGDPEAMPELTYPVFSDFYARHYNPANAYIYLYGDIPTAEYARFMASRLASSASAERTPPLPRQPRWTEPRERTEAYTLGQGEPTQNKTFLTLHWLVGDGTDIQHVVYGELLGYLLLGNAAAPLRKALIDSRLGEDVTFAGFSGYRYETTFHVGLKGSEADRRAAFEQLVFDTLRKCAAEGFPRERVEAGFHQMAFEFLEITGSYPLNTMYKAYMAWLHDADPLAYLSIKRYWESAQREYAKNPALFQDLIRTFLLDNPHRMALTLLPDPGLQARKDQAFAEKMAREKAALAPAELERIANEQAELERRQSEPNSPDALATLPQLRVADLPAKPKHIPTSVETLDGGVTLLRNEVFANGVNYLRLNFDLTGLDPELFAYLPLYAHAIGKMGAAGCDYVKMAERKDASTGGVGFSASSGGHLVDPDRILLRGSFRLKAVDDKFETALSVLRDLLFEPDFSDAKRFHEVLMQQKAALRSSLPQSGHTYALSHAARGLTALGAMDECLHGIPQPRAFRDWADRFDEHRDPLVAKLQAIRAYLLNRSGLVVSFTGSPAAHDKLVKTLNGWSSAMRHEAQRPLSVPFEPFAQPPREGLAAPMQVAYCTRVLPAPHLSHPDAAPLTVGRLMISRGYMWDEIRVKGGAYGAASGWNGLDRSWTFYTYRDPWVKRSLDVFAHLREHLHAAPWTQLDVDRAIIGTAKEGERPIRPESATDLALGRYLMGDTPDRREARHAAVLRVKVADVKRANLEVLEANFSRGAVCVVSSREKLEQANKELGAEALNVEEILP
ncbi:MAG: insulinase family protein [Planctomycetes bacterium]|nr:insulinase family protein [Planctomycetota bacterium]